jgi:hypothetical protein
MSTTKSTKLASLLALAFTLVLTIFALTAASASAAEERELVYGGSFGEGQLSLQPASGVETPGSGVAVNDKTHDVYVADTGNHRVVEFTSTGAFVRTWGWGVTNGKAEPEVCTATCQRGLPGTAPGQFEKPIAIAVDNAPGGEEDVYVSDYSAATCRSSPPKVP